MANALYTRRNAAPEAPGRWITGDGEYAFTHAGKVWTAFHRAHFNETTRHFESLAIGTGPTLDSVFAIASRHYVTPVGQWVYPKYRCSGDMPGAHVECDFTCDTFEKAMDHFEATSHCVDEVCLAVECEQPYHTATYSDLTCGECGLPIMPLQDVEYDYAAGIAYHTAAAHRDMAQS